MSDPITNKPYIRHPWDVFDHSSYCCICTKVNGSLAIEHWTWSTVYSDAFHSKKRKSGKTIESGTYDSLNRSAV